MNVTFFRFDKRRNSMAIPLPSSGIDTTAQINDARTSLLAPILRIAARTSNDPLGMPNLITLNYCYIPNFQRYYFITNWSYGSDNTWSASCEVDVLATYANVIRTSPCYIERAEDIELLNDNVADHFYPAEIGITYQETTLNLGWSNNPSNGCFVIGIITKSSPEYGSVKYYLMNPTQLTVLLVNIMDSMGGTLEGWQTGQDIVDKAIKSIVNPLQYIVSVKWFPFSMSSLGTSEIIMLGAWNTNTTGYPLPPAAVVREDNGILNIPTLSGSLTVEEELLYPQYAPYKNITLSSKLFGLLELSTADFDIINFSKAQITLQTNLITGNCTLKVTPVYIPDPGPGEDPPPTSVGAVCVMRQFALGQPIPITQIATDYVGLASTGIHTIAGAIQADSLLGAALKTFDGLTDAVQLMLSPSVNSTTFGVSAFDNDIGIIRCSVRQLKTVDQDPHEWGYPVYKRFPNGISSTHLGLLTDRYVKCSDFHLVTTTYAERITINEKELVENFMNGGVYYY